jgi:hypothetical protein
MRQTGRETKGPGLAIPGRRLGLRLGKEAFAAAARCSGMIPSDNLHTVGKNVGAQVPNPLGPIRV